MFVLTKHSSIANQYLAELRDVNIQGDRMRFRNNLRRLGFLLGYEISKSFEYSQNKLTTPLARMDVLLPEKEVVVITIMRAGLPFQEGFLDVFDGADGGFIGAWREEGEIVEISLSYLAAPDLNEKTVIIVDPMLATGKSLVKAIDQLSLNGKPKSLHLAAIIAAPEGIDYIKEQMTTPYKLWTCAIDERLNEKSYIVPGLGDAGDLSFGSKH